MKRPLDARIDEDDAALFRSAVGDAVPLRTPPRQTRAPAPGPAVAVQSLLDEVLGDEKGVNGIRIKPTPGGAAEKLAAKEGGRP